jgi:hypothetical protein
MPVAPNALAAVGPPPVGPDGVRMKVVIDSKEKERLWSHAMADERNFLCRCLFLAIQTKQVTPTHQQSQMIRNRMLLLYRMMNRIESIESIEKLSDWPHQVSLLP